MKVIDFKKTPEQQMADERREMLCRLQSKPGKALDEIHEDFIRQINEDDPELAEMINEDIARSGHASMAELRYSGWNIPGTDFEMRRDESDREKVGVLDAKIAERMQKSGQNN